MSKLNIYVVRDEVAQDNTFVVTAKNDEEARNNVKMALCSNQVNFINTHTKDKRLCLVGSIDTDTGIVTGEQSPVLLFTIEEVRLELIAEVSKAKSQVLDLLLKEGVTKEKVKAAKDLLASLEPYFDVDKKEEIVDGNVN